MSDKNKLIRWQLAAFIFTAAAGSLLHFLYEWSGENRFVAVFSAVNESVWEHMKILFFPMFVMAIAESFFLEKEYGAFWPAKLLGVLTGLFLIPALFYTYTGASGTMVDWINISIFYVSAAAAYLLETHLLSHLKTRPAATAAAFTCLCLLTAAFMYFTFFPPDIPLFADPTRASG